jgi:hypothetical protein
MNARFIFALAVFVFFGGQPALADISDWYVIGKDRQTNISGMALVGQTDNRTSFIVVHDNKKKKENRAGIVTIGPDKTSQFESLNWLGSEMPVDLEAITKIPETTHGFMAFSSAGRVYRIELDQPNGSLRVIGSFEVPAIPKNCNFEGFSLAKIGGGYLAVWAERGEDAKPATLFWSNFDLQTNAFTKVDSVSVKVPYPKTNVRHISDLKVATTGKVFISAAADPGNDGPFTSAVYLAGKFEPGKASNFAFTPSAAANQLFSVENRKIEAFELLSEAEGGMVYGTDDENLGSAVYFGKLKK